MFNWAKYTDVTKNKPPRKLLVRALEYVVRRETALDLGAGALNDSKHLLSSGFRQVIAVDTHQDLAINSEINNPAFSFKQVKIEDYVFLPNHFNLINAQFVLPFIAKDKIGEVMHSIQDSLTAGGIFVGQFFGVNDSWKSREDVYLYTEKEVKNFLSGLDLVYFQEEEKDGQTVVNEEKHWHIFHFIAKKSK